MSVNGLVTSVQFVPQGSELTASALLGATTLNVESTVDFDDAGGDLEINGDRYEYLTCDEDALTVTLVTGLLAAAAEDDRVLVVAGGQVAVDYIAFVTMGEGDDAEVEIPYAQRPLWPEGVYDDPVPVLLADDLESIESVPGRTPVIDSTVFQTSADGSRVVIEEIDGVGGVVDIYSGQPGESQGRLAGGISGSQAFLLLTGPSLATDTVQPSLYALSGSASTAKWNFSAPLVEFDDDVKVRGQLQVDDIQADVSDGITIGDTATPFKATGSEKQDTATVTPGGGFTTGTPVTQAVNFGTAFSSFADVPNISLTVYSGNPQNWAVGATSISRSGFTLNVTRTGGAGTSLTVGWVAKAALT